MYGFQKAFVEDQFVKMGRSWRETHLCLFPYHTEGNASSGYFTDMCVHIALLRFSTYLPWGPKAACNSLSKDSSSCFSFLPFGRSILKFMCSSYI